jgi:hypothetical protein
MCDTYIWRKTKYIYKRQGHLVREIVKYYDQNGSVKKIYGRESQGAWRQDEMIDGKPTVVK